MIKKLIYIHKERSYEDFPLAFRVDIVQYFAQLWLWVDRPQSNISILGLFSSTLEVDSVMALWLWPLSVLASTHKLL